MAFFPILLSRKQKRCIFGQKSKFCKKKFFLAVMIGIFGLQSWQNAKIRPCKNHSNYSQNIVNMVFFPNNSSFFLNKVLSDFHFDAQGPIRDLPWVGGKSRIGP